jgi:hypothetical protein
MEVMKKRALQLGFLAVFAAASVYADFGYEQTSKMTGGMLMGAMKVVGVFSKKATEPIKTSVLVRGDQMATVSADSAQVTDLAKETITEINFKNKTYSVITFAQMAQAMEQMSKKVAPQQGGKTDVQFKASIKETGKTQQISGLETREVILTLEMQGTDKESGSSGALTVTSDMWLARDVPGYAEVRAFHQRMAQKVAWAPGSSAFTQGRSDMAKAYADLYKESAKLDGVPVLTVVSMGGSQAEGQPGQAQQQPKQQPQAEPPSAGGALGRLSGLGGLGGLGRSKKKEEPKQEQPAAQSSSASGVLMEMTTEMSGFSSGSVDSSKFQAPAGFKQVESEMLKGLR